MVIFHSYVSLSEGIWGGVPGSQISGMPHGKPFESPWFLDGFTISPKGASKAEEEEPTQAWKLGSSEKK